MMDINTREIIFFILVFNNFFIFFINVICFHGIINISNPYNIYGTFINVIDNNNNINFIKSLLLIVSFSNFRLNM